MTDKKYKGINFSTIAFVFVFILVATYVSLTAISHRISHKFKAVQDTIDSYTACERASKTIKDTASYLTEQAQLFIITHDTKYAEAYIKEKYIERNREKAIHNLLQVTSREDPNYQKLLLSITQAESLASIELYGIRIAYACINDKNIPQQIASIPIRASDLRSNPQELQQIALQTITSQGYLVYKNRISENCSLIINEIENELHTNLQNSSNSLKHMLFILNVIENFLLIFSGIFFFSLFIMILLPLKDFILSIKKKERLKVTGSREMRYLAKTYNEVHEFDVLTKILNRRAFAELCHKFKEDRCDLAFVIIDVDNFKELNKANGHAKGDFILQSVASYLTILFSKDDYVTRIGGDQFGVLVPHLTKNNFPSLVEKINDLNEALKSLQGMEGISVSAGIAFSSDGYNRDLYEAADKALYQAKNNGKCQAAVSEVIL